MSKVKQILLVGLLLMLAGCGPGADKNGRNPEAVVHAFVNAVQAGDFQKAADFWKAGAQKNIEDDYHTTFKEFCSQRFLGDNFQIGRATKQKEQFYSVTFKSKTLGKEMTFVFYLELLNNEWTLNYDVWKPSTDQK